MRSVDVLAAVPGLTYRQLDYWLRTGRVRAPEPDPGSGYCRDIPEREVDVLRVMVALTADGVSPSTAHRVARALSAGDTPTVGGFTLSAAQPAQEPQP